MTTLVPSPAPRKIEAMPEAVAALEAAGFFCNDAAYIYESCDGWACWAVPVYDGDSGPGIRPGWRGADTSDPWLTCRESWDADHAGKEPTVEALREAQERERGKIDDDAIEHGEREYGRHPWRR